MDHTTEELRKKLVELREKHGIILPVIKCNVGVPEVSFTLKSQSARYNYFMPKCANGEFLLFGPTENTYAGKAFLNDLIKFGIVNTDGTMNYQWPEYHMDKKEAE